MKFKILIVLLLFFQTGFGQSVLYNNGTIQIHENGEIGFHTSVINDGTFNQNAGFAGFYNYNGALEVSGTNPMSFYDVEISVVDDLFLNTSMVVTNNLSFLTGYVITPKEDLNVNLEFLNFFVYAGENDDTHVDGYARTTNNTDFNFPIGDEGELRPMILLNQPANTSYNGAYFFEDPNYPSTFNEAFDTSKKSEFLHEISKVEFWDLNGDTQTEIVLTWNSSSDVEMLVDEIKSLRVVGWHKELKLWVDLGGKTIEGDLNEGSVQSDLFIPDNYEIITIGSDFSAGDGAVTVNYLLTPNGDGYNDKFVVEGLELRPNNTMYISNRWGAIVYSKNNYDNSWTGISENDLTINASKGLPAGTYFYILQFHDENIKWQGWIYLRR